MAKVLFNATNAGVVDVHKLKEYMANIAYDLWSFGVVLYYLVTGKNLWGSTNSNGDVINKDMENICKLTSDQLRKRQLFSLRKKVYF